MNFSPNMVFLNRSFDKKRLKALLLWFRLNLSEGAALEAVEILQGLGFQSATQGAISLGLDDLKTPTSKGGRVFQAQLEVSLAHHEHHRGNRTPVELFQHLVDTWHRTSQELTAEVVQLFHSTERVNPVYMMAFSGARGNLSQVRQLVGMRGLMADPRGQIVGFPILSNFREGLTITEYFVSCYGARKGVVDTAIRTADAGYLTRRLADVSHHFVVRTTNCGTHRNICLRDIKEGHKTILPLANRLVGRVLGEHVPPLAHRNQEINPDLASKIASQCSEVFVRSPLSCSLRWGVCQLCYGWGLSEGRRVTLGEAVGIIAAQSIGEPGTQLTLRTFHTGGVFSGDLLTEIRAPYGGTIYFPEPLQGMLVRTPHGQIAFLTKVPGKMFLFPIVTDFANTGKEKRKELNKDINSINKVDTVDTVDNQKSLQIVSTPPHASSDKFSFEQNALLKENKEHSFSSLNREKKEFSFQPSTVIFVRQKEKVNHNQLLAEFSSSTLQPISDQIEVTQQVLSESAGQVWFKEIQYGNRKGPGSGSLGTRFSGQKLGGVWVLSGKPKSEILLNDRQHLPLTSLINFSQQVDNQIDHSINFLPHFPYVNMSLQNFLLSSFANPKNPTQNYFQQTRLKSYQTVALNLYHDNHLLKYKYSLGYSQLMGFTSNENRKVTTLSLKSRNRSALFKDNVFNRHQEPTIKTWWNVENDSGWRPRLIANRQKRGLFEKKKNTFLLFPSISTCSDKLTISPHLLIGASQKLLHFLQPLQQLIDAQVVSTKLIERNLIKNQLGYQLVDVSKLRGFINFYQQVKNRVDKKKPLTSLINEVGHSMESLGFFVEYSSSKSAILKKEYSTIGDKSVIFSKFPQFNIFLGNNTSKAQNSKHPIKKVSYKNDSQEEIAGWKTYKYQSNPIESIFLNNNQIPEELVADMSLFRNVFDINNINFVDKVDNEKNRTDKVNLLLGTHIKKKASAEIPVAWWLQKEWKAAPGMLLAEPFFSDREKTEGQLFWLSSKFIPQKKHENKRNEFIKVINQINNINLVDKVNNQVDNPSSLLTKLMASLINYVDYPIDFVNDLSFVTSPGEHSMTNPLLNVCKIENSLYNSARFSPTELIIKEAGLYKKLGNTEISHLNSPKGQKRGYLGGYSSKSSILKLFINFYQFINFFDKVVDNQVDTKIVENFNAKRVAITSCASRATGSANKKSMQDIDKSGFILHYPFETLSSKGKIKSQNVLFLKKLIKALNLTGRQYSVTNRRIFSPLKQNYTFDRFSALLDSKVPFLNEVENQVYPILNSDNGFKDRVKERKNLLTLNSFWQPLSLTNYPNKVSNKFDLSTPFSPLMNDMNKVDNQVDHSNSMIRWLKANDRQSRSQKSMELKEQNFLTKSMDLSILQSKLFRKKSHKVDTQKLSFVNRNKTKGKKKTVFVQKPIWLSVHISNTNLSVFSPKDLFNQGSSPHPFLQPFIVNRLAMSSKKRRVERNDGSLDQHIVHTMNLPIVYFPYIIPSWCEWFPEDLKETSFSTAHYHSKCGTPVQGRLLPLIRQSFWEEGFFNRTKKTSSLSVVLGLLGIDKKKKQNGSTVHQLVDEKLTHIADINNINFVDKVDNQTISKTKSIGIAQNRSNSRATLLTPPPLSRPTSLLEIEDFTHSLTLPVHAYLKRKNKGLSTSLRILLERLNHLEKLNEETARFPFFNLVPPRIRGDINSINEIDTVDTVDTVDNQVDAKLHKPLQILATSQVKNFTLCSFISPSVIDRLTKFPLTSPTASPLKSLNHTMTSRLRVSDINFVVSLPLKTIINFQGRYTSTNLRLPKDNVVITSCLHNQDKLKIISQTQKLWTGKIQHILIQTHQVLNRISKRSFEPNLLASFLPVFFNKVDPRESSTPFANRGDINNINLVDKVDTQSQYSKDIRIQVSLMSTALRSLHLLHQPISAQESTLLNEFAFSSKKTLDTTGIINFYQQVYKDKLKFLDSFLHLSNSNSLHPLYSNLIVNSLDTDKFFYNKRDFLNDPQSRSKKSLELIPHFLTFISFSGKGMSISESKNFGSNFIGKQKKSSLLQEKQKISCYRLMQRIVEYPVERSSFNRWVTTRRRKLQYSPFSTDLLNNLHKEKFHTFILRTLNFGQSKRTLTSFTLSIAALINSINLINEKSFNQQSWLSDYPLIRSATTFTNFVENLMKVRSTILSEKLINKNENSLNQGSTLLDENAINDEVKRRFGLYNHPEGLINYSDYRKEFGSSKALTFKMPNNKQQVDFQSNTNILPIRNKIWISDKKFIIFDGEIYLDWYAFPLRLWESSSTFHQQVDELLIQLIKNKESNSSSFPKPLTTFQQKPLKRVLIPFLSESDQVTFTRKKDINDINSMNEVDTVDNLVDNQISRSPYEENLPRVTTWLNKKQNLLMQSLDSHKTKSFNLFPGQLVAYGEKIDQSIAATESGQVLYVDSHKTTFRKAQTVLIYSQAILSVLSGEWIKKGTPLMALSYQKLVTGDIVQGLPKIEQFFEAPLLKDGTFWSDSLQAKLNLFFQEHREKLPLAEAVRKGFSDIQRVLVEGVQRVYISQGVLIADKHLEVIVRQMTCKGRILYSGDTGFLRNELVALDKIESVNQVTYGQKALYHPQVRGITDASLESESFLSAASFQETTRVLSRDAVIGKTDLMRGLKERVIVGELIQAGTGLANNHLYNFLLD